MKKAIIILFAVFLGGFLLLNLLLPDRAFSPLENRSLQQRPAPTLQGLLSGRFETRFDSYISDQFPFRDGWIALKSTLDRLAGRTESNGVFLGADGYLIQDFRAPAEADYRRTAGKSGKTYHNTQRRRRNGRRERQADHYGNNDAHRQRMHFRCQI